MTLADSLKALGLHRVAADLDDIISLATRKRFSPVQLLEHVAALEIEDKKKRSLEARLSTSHLGKFKPMADFVWDWPGRIDRPAIEAALHLDFLEAARNVILVAPNGLGKTMIAKNIVHQAILAGHSALFTTAAQMLLDLCAQESARTLERRLKHYARPRLLCIDEVGYLSFDTRNADLFFEVVARRYENKSLILTTNLAFSDWPSIFPSATSATALIDRLVHHATIVPLEGHSYRRRDAEAQARARLPGSAA